MVVAKLHALIAYLLIESKGRQIKATDEIVKSELAKLREVARQIYAILVKYLAVYQKKKTFTKALEIKWSAISNEVRQKFILMLERSALRDCQLNIGRCQDSWAARTLLQAIALNMKNVKVVNEYLEKVNSTR